MNELIVIKKLFSIHNIQEIICDRLKRFIYLEIINNIENFKDIAILLLNKIDNNYLLFEMDYILYNWCISGNYKIPLYHYVQGTIDFFGNNTSIKDEYNNLIDKYNIKKITYDNYDNNIKKKFKKIIQAIFLTNYIDINNIYAITCINIYLYHTKTDKSYNIYHLNALIARLLLLTNTFYLNNYTNYLRISYNKKKDISFLDEYTFIINIKYDLLIIHLNEYLMKIVEQFNIFENTEYIDYYSIIDENSKKIIYDNLRKSLIIIIYCIFDELVLTNEQTKINNYCENDINNCIYILICIYNKIKDKDKYEDKYKKIILFILIILLIFNSTIITYKELKYLYTYFVIQLDDNKLNIIPLKDKLINNSTKNYNNTINAILNDTIFGSISGGAGDNDTNINEQYSIFKNIIEKIDIKSFNTFKEKFNTCSGQELEKQNIKYIKNNIEKGIEFDKLLIKGGFSEEITLPDTKILSYKNPTYLLNYIPMNNCKRLQLIKFIKDRLDK
jgi:hypothetical protein